MFFNEKILKEVADWPSLCWVDPSAQTASNGNWLDWKKSGKVNFSSCCWSAAVSLSLSLTHFSELEFDQTGELRAAARSPVGGVTLRVIAGSGFGIQVFMSEWSVQELLVHLLLVRRNVQRFMKDYVIWMFFFATLTFSPDWNISTTFGWIVTNVHTLVVPRRWIPLTLVIWLYE